MTSKGNILVGTVGQGVMMSADEGESWTRASVRQGMHSDCIVRMLRSDGRSPEVVYAGTDFGLYRSDDGGGTWRLLENPMKGSMVWRIAVDPTNDRNVWVGLEVDGVRYSRDGGETWAKVNGQIPNQDVHNVLVVAGPPKAVFTVVNDDVWRSTDDGKTWEAARAREVFPWHYPRGIAVKPNDPRTVFVTLGDTTPGRIGAVMRSRDAGATWQSLGLPVQPNSAIWTVSMSAAAPETVLAASRYGYLYRSDDSGDSWRKLWREFGEVSSILWVPQ